MSETTETSSSRFRGQPSLSRYLAGANDQLVYCPITGDTQIVSNLKMQLVERCQTFATIDEHAQRLCDELGYGPFHVGATREILIELADTGLLICEQQLTQEFSQGQSPRSDSSTRQQLSLRQQSSTRHQSATSQHSSINKKSPQSDTVPPISSLGIPTKDRPSDLDRCVRSYAECSAKYGRKMTVIVADQSADLQMRKTNLDALARSKKEFGLEILYAGVKEKHEFARRLSDHCGIAPAVVSFALVNDENYRVDTGINRNALLFSTLNQLTMQVDDDSICRIMPSPRIESGIVFNSSFNVYENWFPTEDEVSKLADRCTEQDFFALHERMLGQSLPHCIERIADLNLNFDAAGADFLRKAENNSKAVLATSIGVAGDSGIGSSHYYLTMDGEERARLLATELNYRYSMLNHKIVRSVSRATISDVAFCSGLNLGLDNRSMLPPFLPVQRGQDCVFTNLLHVCLGGYTGFLPWAILHFQSAPAKFSKEDLRNRILYRRSGEIIERLVKGLAPRPNKNSARENMAALGETMTQWGTAPLADFEDLVRGIMWEEMTRALASLQHSLTRYEGHPSYWAKDVNLALSWLGESLTDDKLVVAEDLRIEFGIARARIMLQQLVHRFGELLRVWPDLRQGALELNARDVYLPTTVGRK